MFVFYDSLNEFLLNVAGGEGNISFTGELYLTSYRTV